MRLRAISKDEEDPTRAKEIIEKKAKDESFVLVKENANNAIDIENAESPPHVVERPIPAAVLQELNLQQLMSTNLKDSKQVDYVISEMKKHRQVKKPYKSIFPIKRLKGSIKKVHRTGLQTYLRFLYVNPTEGVLISYHNQNKFPHSPSYMIKLNEIKECGTLFEEKQKWFFKKGMYYFIVRSDSKTSYFCMDNLDLVNYWTTEIHQAKAFHEWFIKL